MIKMTKLETDEMDFKIACLLKDNSKLSYKSIGEQVALSASSVYERTKRMEEKGVIKQYSTDVDWGKFGYVLHAFILLKDDKFIGNFPDFLKEKDGVFNCWMISGEYDYMIEVYVSDNKKFEEMINYLYEKIGRTRTLIVIKNLYEKSVSPEE